MAPVEGMRLGRRLVVLLPVLCLAARGQVTAHRLNRAEYNSSVRDLLGVDLSPADDFPQDDSGYGFDNIAGVLSVAPVLLQGYLNAAEVVAHAALFGPPHSHPTVVHFANPPRALALTGGDATGLSFATALHATNRFPVDGEYQFVATLGGKRPPVVDPLSVGVWIDGKLAASTQTATGDEEGKRVEQRVKVTAGEHVVSASFVGFVPLEGDSVRVRTLDIGGPFAAAPGPSPESLRLVYTCGHLDGRHTPACSRKILSALARRAFRRPVTAEEVKRLTSLVTMVQKKGDSFEEGLAVAMEAILTSPHFLFRIDHGSPYDLASGLSYFLWSSIPDEELLRLAGRGALRRPAVLQAEVRRMLADPRSERLVENFGGQWLETRRLESVEPDRKQFPEFDDYLRYSMRRESELFFANLIRQDRSILDFLDARYTFVNRRLADLYGIPGVEGAEFRRVELAGTPRGGVLTEAAVLTVSSYANRTSPVLRGKWILNNFLDAAPPPPPSGVPPLEEGAAAASLPIRQRMEAHRSNPACIGCHASMDPLGFGLEHFNAIGEWRAHDGSFPVDSTAELPGGRKFDGAVELETVLRADPQAFAECLTKKLLTYALGRGLENGDQPAVDDIVKQVVAGQYRFSSLVLGIVNSPQFQVRGAERRTDVPHP